MKFVITIDRTRKYIAEAPSSMDACIAATEANPQARNIQVARADKTAAPRHYSKEATKCGN